MKTYHLTAKLLLILTLIQIGPALAHSKHGARADLTDLTLEQLMSTKVEAATKTVVRQIEVPQAIAVLNRSDIERIPANNLGELLRSLVGSNVVKAQSSQNILGARGSNAFTPSKILILIDGQPIDPTLFAATWWELVPVSIPDIERIEFIRSPGTIYGSNAQNGVINIVTQKLGLDQDNDHKVRLRAKYGQQNLQQKYIGLLGKFRNFSYRLSSELNEINAYHHPARLQIVPGLLSATGEQTFSTRTKQLDLQNLSGGLQTNLLGNVLTASFGLAHIGHAQGRVPDRLCFVGINGHVGYTNVNYSFSSLGAEHTVSVGTDLINYTFQQNSDTERLTPAEMSLTKVNFGYDFKKQVSARHNFVLGATYVLETASNASGTGGFNEPVNAKPSAIAYVQDEWAVSPKDKIYLGGLFADHYVSGFTFSPMMALVHRLNDRNILRVATFTSYRNPNVFEHSMDYDQVSGASTKRTHLVSNRNLSAERTTSYEVGLRSSPQQNLFFSVDFFVNQVRNGIEWAFAGVDTVPTPRPRYRSENSLSQRTGGVETAVQYRFRKYWSIENNFAFTAIASRSAKAEYQGSDGRGVNGVGQGRYGAEYVPPYIDATIINFDRGKFHTSLQNQYSAAHTWQWPSWSPARGVDQLLLKPVPAYDVTDAYVGIELTQNFGLAFEGSNLFNNRHTEWRGDESYFGRAVRGVINVNLDSGLVKRSPRH